ncbi:MAG: hypothetical protein PHV79_03380 [Clostridia bacterium]|nr:hypothetical protein [Clostridia bacterium]MDD3862870.1 hypothetical protein [Clostridia bacterium]
MKSYKKCPRCNQKAYLNDVKCDECGLVFSRLNFASNLEAKKAIVNGEREKVITTTQFPSDLKRWLAGVLCAFGGFLGLHNFYVGRYFKGAFCFIVSFITIILIFTLESTSVLFETLLWLFPAAAVFAFWFHDLFLIAINKYKVPIALLMPEKKEKEIIIVEKKEKAGKNKEAKRKKNESNPIEEQ